MSVSSGLVFVKRGKVESLRHISVLFHRLVSKCCWVCSVS